MRRMRALIPGGVCFLFCALGLGQQFPREETLEVTEVAGNYVLKVPVSSLVVTIPKGNLKPAQNPYGGGGNSPRYFYLKDDGIGLQITGWFEPQERYQGIQHLWAGDNAEWKRRGLPTPGDVSFLRIGKWDTVAYDHDLPQGRSSHLRAEWVQAGTWLDVHISITKDLPQAELRAKVREVLDNIQVTEKPFNLSVGAGKEMGPVNVNKGVSSGDQRQLNLSMGPASANPRGEYTVPGHGKLILHVPESWKDFSKPLQEPPSVLLRFKPPEGDSFYVQVTAVWLDAAKCANATPKSIKAKVQKSSADPLKRAVEKEAKIEELRGEQTMGYYYSLTDRAPPPDEYKYMTQGIATTGEMMVVFTILRRENNAADKTAALQMLADARYTKR